MCMTHCCCGINLRAGTMAIGCFCAIVGFIGTVTCFVLMEKPKNIFDLPFQNRLYDDWAIIFAVGGTLSLVQLIVSLLLIYGGYQKKNLFMLPWTIFSSACFVILFTSIVIYFFRLITVRDLSMLGLMAGKIFDAGLLLYFLSVVGSYDSFLLKQRHILTAPVGTYPINIQMAEVQNYPNYVTATSALAQASYV